MSEIISHWIDGALDASEAARYGEVHDPSQGRVTAQVALADDDAVDRAVQAARTAYPAWRDLSLGRRQQAMFRLKVLLEDHAEEVAAAITAQHGKTLDDALGEVARGLEVVEFACGLPHLLKGRFSENVSTDIDTYSIRQPLGVVAGITPFNFPAMVPLWMFPMALACGNTFVLKPSEKDPGAAMVLARLVTEAGFPPGVFNVLHGDKEAVNGLLDHPEVDAISFVGSTPVAKHIYETGTHNGKRVQALGGAKNHLVVMPDADLELAADALTSAAYGSAGERCMAISVAVAVGGVGDELRDLIASRAKGLKVGAGLEDDVDMGPLVTVEHRDKVASYIEAGRDAGADLVVDGSSLRVADHEDGYFFGPTLFDQVTPEMPVYTDEIFGPVLSMVRVGTLKDAIDLINANPYGNGVSLYTRDGAAARTFQSTIEVGMIGINVPIPVPVSMYSFGGWKDSLFGDLHIYGEDAIQFYSRQKVVTTRWSGATSGIDLGFPSGR